MATKYGFGFCGVCGCPIAIFRYPYYHAEWLWSMCNFDQRILYDFMEDLEDRINQLVDAPSGEPERTEYLDWRFGNGK